jgi:hypothetical protein
MKKIFLFIIIVSGLLTTQSCSDFLEREPVNITHPDVFWVNQSNAEQALAGAYAHYKYAYLYQSNFLFWGEFTGMTFMNSRNWIVNYIEGSGNYNLPYRPKTRNWKDFYRAANWALTIEHYVENMDDGMFNSVEDKKRIIGEAAFIRGLTYFTMAKIWGDVPIIEEVIESSDQLINDDGYIVEIPRSPELDVLDFALEAANKAIDNLEYASPGDARWAITANKASAEALKAHIALWYAARDNDNQQMIQTSIDAASSVIQNGNASLIDYVADTTAGFNRMCEGQSETGLFEINISSDMNESFRVSAADSYHTGLTLSAPFFKGKPGGRPEMDPNWYGNEFMNNDPDYANDIRRKLFFYNYDEDWRNAFLLKYSQTSPDPDAESDPYARFSESNILIFRLADIYLLRAEAYAKSGDAGNAVQDLNMVRSKAGVPAYTGATDRPELIRAIFNERAIELVGEGQSGFDRIRMDYFYDGVGWMNSDRIQKKGYFWPVDPSIISVNPAIEQTEFWRGKL